MFDFIADLLNKYKEKYKQNRKIFGNTYVQDYKNYICLMENGELVKPDYVDRTFKWRSTFRNSKMAGTF